MASRPYFIAGNGINNFYIEKTCEFQFYTGFALAQKQKSIKSLHSAIKKLYPNSKILEVSRRSENTIGIQLSAFNLKYYDKITNREYPVENVFQSSKVFEHGGPYKDLLSCTPGEAKTDFRIRNSGEVIKFCLHNENWSIAPKTLFYDYIYISALYRNKRIINKLLKYDIFTDIEFNPKKSLNCQARSVAIFVSLAKNNLLEKYLNNRDLFKTIYKNDNNVYKQLTLLNL